MELRAARLVISNTAYIPGTPITKQLLEALAVRVVGELTGLVVNGWVHCALQLDITTHCAVSDLSLDSKVDVDLSNDGVEYYYHHLTIEAPWVTQYLMLELNCASLPATSDLLQGFGMCGARVTNKSLLKKALGIPLSQNEFLCTDFIQYHLDPDCVVGSDYNNCDHWTPQQALAYAMLNNTTTPQEGEDGWPISFTTLDVPPVTHVTMWQCMLMGVVTALGVGHIIRPTHLKW